MFYVLQNESTAALRRVPILLTDAATGTTAQTGVATTNIFPYVNINGGAFAGGAGTIAEAGYGQYYYEMDPSEISTLGLAGIHITAAGCRDYDAIAQIAALNVYSASGAGISAADVWNYTITNTGQSADDTLANASQSASSADTNASAANNQTVNISGQVWETDLGAGAYNAGTAGTILYDLSLGGGGITAGDVWSYVDRTITGGTATTVTNPVLVDPASMTGIAGTVWNFVITGFGNTGSAAEYSTQTNFTVGNIETYVANQTPQDVWTYAGIEGRTITGGLADTVTTLTNPANVTTGSMSGIAGTVWNSLVASYSTNGTFGKNILRADTANKVGDVTLYSSGGVNGVDADVHRIANDTAAATALKDILTGIGSSITGNITGNLSGSVGSVTADVNVSEVSMSGIANTVWSTDVSGYASPSAGYDLSNATAGGGITAGDVWSYVDRTITGGIADTVSTVTNGVTVTTNNDKSGYSLSGTQSFNLTGNITGNVSGSVGSVTNAVTFDSAQYAAIASSVWNAPTRTLTSSGSGISAADVWNYGTRTITGGIADTVTTLTDRSGFAITGGTITTVSDKTGYSLSASQTFDVTGNITGNLSGSVGSVAGNVSGSVASVVGNVGGNVAGSVASVSGNVGGNVVGSVASVTAPVSVATASMTGIAGTVWNYGTRTLTSGGSGISAYDVWNFVLSDANTAEVDLVQAASGVGLSAGDVWTYASRTITGGIADTVTTITNRSGFAVTGGTVNTVTNGVTVTTNNDKTGYALSTAGVSAVQSGLSTLTQAQVGTEVDSSLSDVGLTSTVTGRIDATISSRLASASYTAPPTEAAIAGTVWGYNSRTLTSGAGATAGDVWTYPTRSLTSGAGITVNAATNIINGPYFVKSNVDSQDGTLDVIRGMVQDIQLTVTDAFQNPFDTTALGLLVNFYDQAGTLTTSYATTELYGPAGLVQFTLDTAVTANEGRYNLILSAAGSGNTIKFGPLQTLVRPF